MTADTGIDALTHALEAYVSIFASPYTDAFCLQAIHLIFGRCRAPGGTARMSRRARRWPTRRRSRGSHSRTRSSASTTPLPTRRGRGFGIAHGRANGIFLPHVLRYNASLPSKFMPAPGYSRYVAPEKYAQIARVIGLGGKTEEIARARLFDRVDALLEEVEMPRSLAAAGVARDAFEVALPALTKNAFSDASLRTNPRIPLIRELADLLQAGYEDP